MSTRAYKWAASHDWFVWARQEAPNVWTVFVRDECFHADGTYTDDEIAFTDLATLRAWAGY